MEKISVKVKTKDISFASALARSLMETGRVNITSDLDAKVMLVDEEIAAKEAAEEIPAEKSRGKAFKVVLKRNALSASWTEGIPSMYRYTSAGEMVSLLEYIMGIKKSSSHDRAKVITLISDEGGSGVSTIGINLGRALSRKGEGAIYLNICPFSTSPKEVLWGESERAGGKAWMRMLFGMKKGRSGILQAVIEKIEETAYIPCPRINIHADGIDEEILMNLRKEAVELGYEYLLFDMGTHPEGNRRMILDSSDVVVAVNPGYDLEIDLRRKEERKLITVVNLYRDDLIELEAAREADIHIGYITGIGRTSIDMELKEPIEKLGKLIVEALEERKA